MVRRTQAEMEETRIKLLNTARKVFSEQGYALSAMEDLTSKLNLTRGALYHHFGDKKGLFQAVVHQIDQEMDERLQDISDQAPTVWEAFTTRCQVYLEMAQEPDIQRIILRDAPAILGNTSQEAQKYCISSMQNLLKALIEEGKVQRNDPELLARMIYGSLSEASFWIAESNQPQVRLQFALQALNQLLDSILVR